MFVLFTRRVVKKNTYTKEKFAPRSVNEEKWHASGPFTSRKSAERAALACLATHTCLSATVVPHDQAESFMAKNDWLGNTTEVRRQIATMSV